MNEQGPRSSTGLTLSLLLVSASSLTACEIGYKPIGGFGETETGHADGDTGDGDGDPGDGDGDPGDGDGDPGDGDGDGTTFGDCLGPAYHEFDIAIDVMIGDPNVAQPIDSVCTINSITTGVDPNLKLVCNGTDIQIAIETGEWETELVGQAGDPVHLWLSGGGQEYAPTWLRLDFPETDESVVLIYGPTLSPPDGYFPLPWGLEVIDSCGPVDDGCSVLYREEILLDTFLGFIQLTGQGAQFIGHIDERATVILDRADDIVEVSPVCDPSPDFFNSHRLFVYSRGLPVEGDVCQPGETDPCMTGLECCYPCGVQGCDYVCTPEDPQTMGCPPPPP